MASEGGARRVNAQSWREIVLPVLSVVVSLVAVVVTFLTARLASQSSRESQIRADRTEAYAAFLGLSARFEDFLWNNVYWAGSDRERTPEEQAAFWEDAETLEAEMKTTYYVARMLAPGDGVAEPLESIHHRQETVFYDFKCRSGVQQGCVDEAGAAVPVAAHAAIEQLLTDWSAQASEDVDALLSAIGEQVGR